MKRLIQAIVISFCLFALSGCGNLSPRQDQEIQNQKGKIGEIESLANSMKADIGNIKSQADIQNSKLDRIQQGLANVQSNYDNQGVMIFSGSGGIASGIAIVLVFGFLCLHYRSVAKANEKVATILAERVVNADNPELLDSVFTAVMHTDVEEHVLKLVKTQLARRAELIESQH